MERKIVLTEEETAAMKLYLAGDRSLREIAPVFGCTHENVRGIVNTLSKGRQWYLRSSARSVVK